MPQLRLSTMDWANRLDYALALACTGVAVWRMSPWWLAAALICALLAYANPGEWLRRRLSKRFFHAPRRR